MLNRKSPPAETLLTSEAGNGFVEKLIIVALFAFVVSAGIRLLANKANDKLGVQGDEISGLRGTIKGR